MQTATEALAAMMPHPQAVLTLGDLSRLPHERHNLPVVTAAERLGAIIYTSGSTGVPKGVMLEQQAMCGLATASGIAITPEDVLLFLSSPAFDAATFEVWGALLNGAKLVVIRDTEDIAGDVPQLEALLRRQQVSILWATRSLFDHLYLSNPDLFAGLRYLLVGGEALTATLMQRLVRQPHRPQWVINGYGPTECTTFTTMYAIAQDEARSSIPIGRAIPGRELYVLDRWRHRCRRAWPASCISAVRAGARLSQPAAANPGEFHRVARPAPIQNRRSGALAARRQSGISRQK